MRKLRSITLLFVVLSLYFTSAIALTDDEYPACERISPDSKSVSLAPNTLYIVNVDDPSEYLWSSSNTGTIKIMDDVGLMTNTSGKSTITGKPKNGDGKTIRISASVSFPYVSSKNIVIDSPDGAELITALGSGIIMTNYTGDKCFKVQEIEHKRFSNAEKYKILPVSVGEGKIVYDINFQKRITVNVTVKKSALMTKEEQEEIRKLIGDNPKTGTIIKDVNIRESDSSDSDRVAYAKTGKKVTVIHPYYSPKWHQIYYNDQICYVSAKYVKIDE